MIFRSELLIINPPSLRVRHQHMLAAQKGPFTADDPRSYDPVLVREVARY